MKSKFVLLCLAITTFLVLGYFYKQHYYPSGIDALTPDMAAAKAKACTEAFEKMEARPSCEGKLLYFQGHWDECNDQKVSYRENIFSYSDYYFEIVDCLVAEGKDAKATEVLHQIEKLPPWRRLGPTDCSIPDETKARIESLSFPDNTCLKEADLQSWVGTSPDLSGDLIKQLALRNHSLSCGTFNSDDICFTPLDTISKFTRQNKNLVVAEVEATDHAAKHIHFVNPDTGRKALILQMSEQGGCLFLSAIYSVDGAE